MNYPDGLSDYTPNAPWNQRNPEVVRCPECDHETDQAESGDACLSEPDEEHGQCGGSYMDLHCTECGLIACRCDDGR